MLDSLPYDILELVVFRLRLLTAGDIGALKRTCRGLDSLLSAEYDMMRHHALGGLRHCLDSLNPAAALFALKHLGADPATDNGRALRVAIRTGHAGLFDWLFADGLFARHADFHDFVSDLDFCLKAGNDRAFLKLYGDAHRLTQARAIEHFLYNFEPFPESNGNETPQPPLIVALAVNLLQTHEDSVGIMRPVARSLLMVFPPERALDAVPLESYLSGGGADLHEIIARRCVQYSRKKGRESTARRLLGILTRELSPKRRTALAYALAGVGRLDLAEAAAPHPALFDFVIAPSTPGEILDLVQSRSFPFRTLESTVLQHTPTEVLAERLSGSGILDLKRRETYDIFVEVLHRSDAATRAVLHKLVEGLGAQARKDIGPTIEAIIMLGAQDVLIQVLEEATEVIIGHYLFENADLRSHEFAARCLKFAHAVKYFSAMESLRTKKRPPLIRLERRIGHKLGFFGVPEEVAEILAGTPARGFSLDDYRLGQECWRTMEAPNDATLAKYSFWDRNVFAARPLSFGEVHAKVEAWASAVSDSRTDHEVPTFSVEAIRACALIAAMRRALDDRRDQLVVELAVELEGRTGYIEKIVVPPCFAPKLIAAGLDPGDLDNVNIRTYPEAANSLEELEFCISGVWPGVTSS